MKHYFKYWALLLLAIAPPLFAKPTAGLLYSPLIISHVPNPLSGQQFYLTYDPGNLVYKNWRIAFAGAYSHFKSPGPATSIAIWSFAPVFHFTLLNATYWEPYIELSIGLSYLNHTRIEKRNLGIHFAFQDSFNVGMYLGKNKRWILGGHIVHYSNAHLSSHNSGITIPLILDIGYRFY